MGKPKKTNAKKFEKMTDKLMEKKTVKSKGGNTGTKGVGSMCTESICQETVRVGDKYKEAGPIFNTQAEYDEHNRTVHGKKKY